MTIAALDGEKVLQETGLTYADAFNRELKNS
jgi:hypothetical protein